MHQNHGVGYAEYERKLEKQLKVEQDREISHKKSLRIFNEMDRLVHR